MLAIKERIIARIRITFDAENGIYGRELVEVLEDTSKDDSLRIRLKEHLQMTATTEEVEGEDVVGKVFTFTLEKSNQF